MADIFAMIEVVKSRYKGKKFNGIPDPWFDEVFFWCENGHRSRAYLRAEGHDRDECLECFGPVRMGPKELPGVVPL
jgi:hypothetical protein